MVFDQFFISFSQDISKDYVLMLKINIRKKVWFNLKAKMWRRGYDGLGK